MNKFQSLQTKLQSTVQGLNTNLSEFASDQATKLKQQISDNVQTSSLLSGITGSGSGKPSASAPTASTSNASTDDQQYLKLPVESAKKLRWFDREDMGMLIDLHLREKQELYDANAALRTILLRNGGLDVKIDAELKHLLQTVDQIRSHDRGVNEVLVLSVRAELEQANEKAGDLEAQLQSLQQRLAQQQATAQSNTSKEAVAEADKSSDSPAEQLPSDLGSALKAIADAPSTEVLAALSAQQSLKAKLSSLFTGDESDSRDNNQSDAASAAVVQELQSKVSALEQQRTQLQTELDTTKHSLEIANERAEKKLADVKLRLTNTQQGQQDLLRVAQDRQLEAESRFEAAEARATSLATNAATLEKTNAKYKERITALEQQIRQWEKEASDVAVKLASAEKDAQKERVKAQTDSALQETAAQLKSRNTELEASLASTKQQLNSAQFKISNLETKLASAEMATAKVNADLRELELAAADRDNLAVKLAATQAKLDEIRSEQANADALRGLATQSEARRAQAEDELVVTARLAASLENRLTEAMAEIESYKVKLDEAENRVQAAQVAIVAQVTERWEHAGADKSKWPPAAQSEIENVEARLHALQSVLGATEQTAAQAQMERDEALAQKTQAETIAHAAKEKADRIQRESMQREQRLQAAASAATMQVNEFRAALTKLENERDRLLAEKKKQEAAAEAATAAVAAAATRHAGGGSIHHNAGTRAISNNTTSDTSDNADLPSPVLRSPLKGRETLTSTDIIYLKNVLLKFIDAQLNGRTQECEVLLPAVAALLQATPAEFHVLKNSLHKGSLAWLVPDSTSWFSSSAGSNGVVPH